MPNYISQTHEFCIYLHKYLPLRVQETLWQSLALFCIILGVNLVQHIINGWSLMKIQIIEKNIKSIQKNLKLSCWFTQVMCKPYKKFDIHTGIH
jgi:hypothetical protein